MANYKKADDPKLIEEALKATGGNITGAARALNVSRTCIYRRIEEYPELKEVLNEQREIALDEAERILKEKWLDERDVTSLIFFLKTQGFRRGYGNKTQLVGDEQGGPVKINVTYEDE